MVTKSLQIQTVQRPTTQSDPVKATILDDATENGSKKTVDNVDEDIRGVRPKAEIFKYEIFEICVKTDVSLQMQGIPEPLRDHRCWNFTFILRIAVWQTSVADLDGWLGTQCVGRHQNCDLDDSWWIPLLPTRPVKFSWPMMKNIWTKIRASSLSGYAKTFRQEYYFYKISLNFYKRSWWWSSRIIFQTIFNRIFIKIFSLWLLKIVNLFSIVLNKSRKEKVISWRG